MRVSLFDRFRTVAAVAISNCTRTQVKPFIMICFHLLQTHIIHIDRYALRRRHRSAVCMDCQRNTCDKIAIDIRELPNDMLPLSVWDSQCMRAFKPPRERHDNACRGYVIKAMENCGFKSNDIRQVLTELYEVFDFCAVEEAAHYYEHWQS